MTDEAANTGTNPAMPLLYNQPVGVSYDRHKNVKLKQNRRFTFAAKAHAVPCVLDEVPVLSGYYPLVFTPGDQPALVGLMGVRPEENLIVNEDGTLKPGWPLPAYLLRYPFILVQLPDEDRQVMVMEEDPTVVGPDGDLPLFDDNGQPSKHGQDALNYCAAFNRSVQITQAFCKELNDRGLLIDQRADLVTPDGKQIALSGFRIVDENKLNELPDDVFIAWRRKNWVGLIYAHLLSLGRWNGLLALMAKPAAND